MLDPKKRAAYIAFLRRRAKRKRETVEERRELARNFRWFVEEAWPYVEPRTFIPGKHIDVTCDFLQDYYINGKGEDALINVPPGTAKSLICSVLWQPWIWATQAPWWRGIFTSYADGIVRRDAIRCRNLIQSEWWQETWPEIQIPFQNTHAASDWTTTQGGWRISVPLFGQVVGRHGDGIIIDDPIKPEDARLERAALEEVGRVIDETLPTRLLEPAKGHRLLVMQRLHEKDPAGVWLDKKIKWRLVLPMEYEPNHPFLDTRDWRKQPGDLLWPQGRTAADVVALKNKMTPYAQAGQLQQRPAPEGGGMFKRDHVRWYKKLPSEAEIRGQWCIVVDASFKGTSTSDYVAIGVLNWYQGKLRVVEVVREKMGFLTTCEALIDVFARHPRAVKKLIEAAANGAAIVDFLKRKGISGIDEVKPEGGKEARAHVLSALWEAGDVEILEGATWAPALIHEMCSFPGGSNDDQVDMLSHGANWFLKRSGFAAYAEGVRKLKAAW